MPYGVKKVAGGIVEKRPSEDELFDLAELFKVFGDSTRIKILFSLLEKEMAVGGIAQSLSMTQSAISHQLRILKDSALVKYRREGRQLIYSLSDFHVHTIIEQGLNHVTE